MALTTDHAAGTVIIIIVVVVIVVIDRAIALALALPLTIPAGGIEAHVLGGAGSSHVQHGCVPGPAPKQAEVPSACLSA